MTVDNHSITEPSTIVLLHSLGTNRRLWRYQQRALTGRYQVHVPEAPGHGSRPWTGQATLDAFVADLDDQLIDVSGRLHLVGVSMGGHLALGYAAAHPDRVASVVVANSFARLPGTQGEERVATMATDITEGGMARYAARYLEQTLTRELDAEDRIALHDAIAGMTAQAYLAAAGMTFGGDLTGLCGQLSCPALVISGAQDHKVPDERTAELVAALGGPDLTVVPDAGHLSCIEQPELFTAAVTSFVDRVGTAAALEGAHR